MGSQNAIEVAALGRPFQLGMLYDCRSERLIPGITLWDNEDLDANIREVSQHNTEFQVIASDSLEDKASALDIGCSLKFSVLVGLFEVGGSAKYLNDKMVSKKQARVTLKYKTTTKLRQLSMSHLAECNYKYPYVFDKRSATHVVTGILYGAQAFFVFNQEVSSECDHKKVMGKLKAAVKEIADWNIGAEAYCKKTNFVKEKSQNFSCTFYGDFALEDNPVSFEDAVRVYKKLPKLLGDKGQHAVPLKVWLLPLETLDSSAAKLEREISVPIVQIFETILESLIELQMECKDLMANPVIKTFPDIGKNVKEFENLCVQYRTFFQVFVKKTLPLIREGKMEEKPLEDFLQNMSQSFFSYKNLNVWLDCKEREVNLFNVYTNMLSEPATNIRIVVSSSQHDKELVTVKHVLCFAFTSVNQEEPYLTHFSNHVKALSNEDVCAAARGEMKSENEWHLSEQVKGEMRKQAKLFMDFAKANTENQDTHFTLACKRNHEHTGATIYLYTEGIQQSDHYEPPSQPDKPTVIDRTHDSVTIKLHPPQCGSSVVTHYLIEYCAKEMDNWDHVESPNCNQEFTVSGLTPHTEYKFRYKAVCLVGVGPVSEVSDGIKTLPTSPPDGLKVCGVYSSEGKITWKKPTAMGAGISIQTYIVQYRRRSPGVRGNEEEWSERSCDDTTYNITELQPDTTYDVRVGCTCSDHGQSKDSVTVSFSTRSESTTINITENIKKISKCISNGEPSVYNVPLEVIKMNSIYFNKFAFGKANKTENRVIMVVGATGSGKSTLINGMINYILGVKWEDEFRFKLIDEGVSKSQAESQTSFVTAYDINYQEGLQISNSVTIIDTPGFGDTRGIERDREITEQICEIFNSRDGITEIDAVCFVTPASLARLTPTQKYVFDSILSIFGKDIAENIQILVTFSDGQTPPVLEAITASGVPCPKTERGLPVHFKFNNSALFEDNSTAVSAQGSDDDLNFDKIFWKIGENSMKAFFNGLAKMDTKSLVLTREVLEKRRQLETAVCGLQAQVRVGLAKLGEINVIQRLIKQHKLEMDTNKIFKFKVQLTKPFQIFIGKPGKYITNCHKCFVTCHYPCTISDDKEKYKCRVMKKKGICRVCPGKCHWSVHYNQQYRWEYKAVTEERTSEELKAKYEKASGAKVSAEEMIVKQDEEVQHLQDHTLELIDRLLKCLVKLQEIALKPNPLSTPEYIDLLIASEKSEAKEGFLQRIQSLEAMRDQAEIIEKIRMKETLEPDELKKTSEKGCRRKAFKNLSSEMWNNLKSFFD